MFPPEVLGGELSSGIIEQERVEGKRPFDREKLITGWMVVPLPERQWEVENPRTTIHEEERL
jgi:hypothetical protein